MPIICSQSRGTVNLIRENGEIYEANAYEHISNCELADHRILDDATWIEVQRFSDYTTDQLIAALFPASEVIATFTAGFIVVFGLAALAYNIKIAKNQVRRI
jgi:hypothetical protein